MFLYLIPLAAKLIHMLNAAIQLPKLDCLLQSELWHFHRYSYSLIKELSEAKQNANLWSSTEVQLLSTQRLLDAQSRQDFLVEGSGQSSLQD